MREATDYKQAAIEQWTADPCGAAEGEPGSAGYFERLLAARHEYAPWMVDELDYTGARDLDVLDVGCGQGIDVARYALSGARATGIDLTPRHVELTRAHLAALGLEAKVELGDAENLPFADGSFDRVSSNGVLHHTPDMPAALAEILRVLRPDGEARIIVYNKRSFHYWLMQVAWEGVVHRKLLRERSMAGVLRAGRDCRPALPCGRHAPHRGARAAVEAPSGPVGARPDRPHRRLVRRCDRPEAGSSPVARDSAGARARAEGTDEAAARRAP